jgi:proteasome lid subunit RPN8/RPN11
VAARASRRCASAAAWASRWSSRWRLPEPPRSPESPAPDAAAPAGVAITQAALDTIAAHAQSEHPRECCGLLIGTGQAILKAVPVENVAADPFRRYEIAATDYLAEIHRCREQGGAVVGAYHSHPISAPQPSATDLQMAFSEFIFVIVGEPAAGGEVRAYVLHDGSLAELTLNVM